MFSNFCIGLLLWHLPLRANDHGLKLTNHIRPLLSLVSGAIPPGKGLVWFTNESRKTEGVGTGVHSSSVGRRLSVSLGMYAAVFQAEVYVILACVYEIQTKARPEKYVGICSDGQAALEAVQAAKRASPLVRHCQQALNVICTGHTVGLYWVPGHAGV